MVDVTVFKKTKALPNYTSSMKSFCAGHGNHSIVWSEGEGTSHLQAPRCLGTASRFIQPEAVGVTGPQGGSYQKDGL